MTLTAFPIAQRGPYRLEQQLGQGLLSTTYRAVDTRSGKMVILKTLSESLLTHPQSQQFSQQFYNLARRFAACPHPNILRIQDVFIDRDQPFYGAEYILGQTLVQVLQNNGGPLDEQKAVHYIRQVANGVAALHRQGLYHGDIQPQNILLETETDRIILTDFNVGRSLTPGHGQTQAYLKSVGYTAPELSETPQTLSPPTEIYSLAATLYYLLTGMSPVPASLRSQVPLLPPRQLQPQLSIVIEQALILGLQPLPQQRPQSLAVWLELLPTSPSQPSSLKLPKVVKETKAQNTPQPAPQNTPQPAPQNTTKNRVSRAIPQNRVRPQKSPQESPQKSPSAKVPFMPLALLITALLAGASGAGFGFAIRYHASQSPGSSLLNSEQTFPPRDQWPISDHPVTSVQNQSTQTEVHHR